jgi:hypothetical protein
MEAAIGVGGAVYLPPGIYRVTSTFINSTAYGDLRIYGDSSSRALLTNKSSIILLDNASAAVGFYFSTGTYQHLQVRDITCKCNQEVTDRPFFKFSTTNAHSFSNVNFESVERPVVYATGCYFQNASFRDVQFRGSGTIHSEFTGTGLAGTLLVLDNVNHETTVPNNTDKVVCNLYGIRNIQATNFLLEGFSPGAGWTILKLGCEYNTDWQRASLAHFHGYWSEWPGTAADYAVDQLGGRAIFSEAIGVAQATSPYRVRNRGVCVIQDSALTGTGDQIVDRFSVEDFKSHVIFERCSIRDGLSNVAAKLYNDKFTFVNCSLTKDGSVSSEGVASTIFSTTMGCPLYRWDGGYLDGTQIVKAGSDAYTPSVDATYGRKLAVTPASASSLALFLSVPSRGILEQHQQMWICLKYKLPTFSDGSIIIYSYQNSATVATIQQHQVADSGGTFELVIPVRLTQASITSAGVRISANVSTTLGSTLDIYALAFYAGGSAPQAETPNYPLNIETYNSAEPGAGQWNRGDRVWNNAPSAAGVPGWVCTTAGTPGTWKAMAVLAA